MPAQGRGAFLTPRAPAKPPPLPPHRAPVPVPHPSLAGLVGHAIAQAQQTVKPATRAAAHVTAAPITRGVNRTAGRAARAVRGKPGPVTFPAGTRVSGGSPLLNPGSLHAALIEAADEARARRGGSQLGGLREATQLARPPVAPVPGGTGLLGTILGWPGAAVTQGYANILGTSGAPGAVGRILGHTAADAISLGELPFVGALQAGEAGAGLAKGDTRPAQQAASALIEGLKSGAIGQLVQGNPSGALHAAQEHPLLTGLEAEAGLGALERGPAAVLREGKPGTRVRAPLALADDAGLARTEGYLRQRTFSKVPHREAIQRLADRRRAPVLGADGLPVRVQDRGANVPVLQPLSERETRQLQQRRANYESSRHVNAQRAAREGAQAAYVEAQTGPGRLPLALRRTGVSVAHLPVRGAARRTVGQAVDTLSRLYASGTLRTARTLPEDLTARIAWIRRQLTDPSNYRHTGDLEAARENLKWLEAIRNDRRVMRQIPAVVERGQHYSAALNDAERNFPPGLYDQHRLAQGRLSEYALAHMGAEHNGERIVGPGGQPLTHAEIEAHARAGGRSPSTLAYLPHEVSPEQSAKYYRALHPEGRPLAKDLERTGALYRVGATDTHGAAVMHELAAKATITRGITSFDKIAQESGLKHPAVEKAAKGLPLSDHERQVVERHGGYFTGHEAAELADRLAHDTKQVYVPVRAFGGALSKETSDAVREAQSPQAAMETAHMGLLNDRFADTKDTRTRNVVLMPAHQLRRLQEQAESPKGSLTRFAQMLNGPFRMAVLSQPRWLTGNFLEPFVMRLPLDGSGVLLPGMGLDVRAYNKVLGRLEGGTAAEKETAAQMRALYESGRFVGGKGQAIHRTASELKPGSRTQAVAHAGAVVRHFPVVKQLGDLVLAWPKSFFYVNRHLIENPTAKAAIGKQMRRDIGQITGHWIDTAKLGQKAVDEVAKGLVDTPTQHRYAEGYYEMLGQYDGFSPTLKHWIQSYTPFLPWTLASMRFVYWTLPAHHSLVFNALAKAGQGVMPEWEAQHRDTPPGTLRDAIVGKDGGLVDIAHYFPYGATIPLAQAGKKGVKLRNLTEPFTSTIAPQAQGTLNYLQGLDPFGRELQFSGGKEPALGEELGGLLTQGSETVLPILSTLRRIREGGGTAYANSSVIAPKVKPGTTHQSGLNRALNPFRETYLKAPPGAGGSAGGSAGLTPREQHRLQQAEQQLGAGSTLTPREEARLKAAEERLER